jgi:hypothetical protein
MRGMLRQASPVKVTIFEITILTTGRDNPLISYQRSGEKNFALDQRGVAPKNLENCFVFGLTLPPAVLRSAAIVGR